MSSVIEISKRYDIIQDKPNNEWINNLGIPQQINDGDNIQINACILDTPSTSFDNIEILEDTVLTIKNGFYSYNLPTPVQEYKTINRDNFQFFDLSIIREYQAPDFKPIEMTKTITIKAGNYSPENLAEILTRNLNNLVKPTSTTKDITVDLLRNYNQYYLINPRRYYILNAVNVISETALPNESSVIIVDKSEPGSETDFANGDTNITINYTTKKGTFQVSNATITDIQTYPPDVTKLQYTFNKSLTGDATTDYYNIIISKRVPGDSYFCLGSMNAGFGADVDEDVWIGAQTFNINYNKNNNGKFSISAYTPPYDPKTNNIANIVFVSEKPVYQIIPSLSGIFLTSLEPRSFWFDTLGFDESILCSFDANYNLIGGKLTPGVNISTNFIDYNTLTFNSVLPLQQLAKSGSQAITVIYQDTAGVSIDLIAKNNFSNSGNKFLYIYADLSINMNSYYRDGRKGQLMGIINRSISNDGGLYDITPFPYIHRGEPIIISSINVNILDQFDKPATLNKNNSVFFQIIKGINK